MAGQQDGQAPPAVLLLHGGGQGSWVWRETVAALQVQSQTEPLRAICLDAPGCGTKRDRDTTGLTIVEVADELLAEIREAGIERAILVAHSQGGQAAVWMARQQPELFAHIFHVACSVPKPGQTLVELIGQGLHGDTPEEVGWPVGPTDPRNPSARYREMFCNDMTAAQADALLAAMGADMWPAETYSARDWPTEHLAAIPATYIVCLRDGMLPITWQERFAERFKVGRSIRIDAGHQAMTTRPHALAEIIRQEALR